MKVEVEDAKERPELAISGDDAFYILMRAREFDEKTPNADPDSGSNAVDDGAADTLEDQADDSVEAELTAAIRGLNDDAQLDLIALTWIGRGDFTLAEWRQAREAARDIGRARIVRYLREIPLLSDYLDEGLSQMGFSLEDYMAG
ncbi:MAG: DUF3775 domain-containing protein [Proteobacteria bacterium]|nr:DUF3775 domain-containing protein [Pseudomonadota bacterium]